MMLQSLKTSQPHSSPHTYHCHIEFIVCILMTASNSHFESHVLHPLCLSPTLTLILIHFPSHTHCTWLVCTAMLPHTSPPPLTPPSHLAYIWLVHAAGPPLGTSLPSLHYPSLSSTQQLGIQHPGGGVFGSGRGVDTNDST